jgi:hypothetical protein
MTLANHDFVDPNHTAMSVWDWKNAPQWAKNQVNVSPAWEGAWVAVLDTIKWPNWRDIPLFQSGTPFGESVVSTFHGFYVVIVGLRHRKSTVVPFDPNDKTPNKLKAGAQLQYEQEDVRQVA